MSYDAWSGSYRVLRVCGLHLSVSSMIVKCCWCLCLKPKRFTVWPFAEKLHRPLDHNRSLFLFLFFSCHHLLEKLGLCSVERLPFGVWLCSFVPCVLGTWAWVSFTDVLGVSCWGPAVGWNTWGCCPHHFCCWLQHTGWGILVSWPGIEPLPPAVATQSLNHWTTGEVPCPHLLVENI